MKIKTLCKTILPVIVSALIASCSTNPADQAKEVIEKATNDFNKASSEEEIISIYNSTHQQLNEIAEKNADYHPTTEQADSLNAALRRYQKAFRINLQRFHQEQ